MTPQLNKFASIEFTSIKILGVTSSCWSLKPPVFFIKGLGEDLATLYLKVWFSTSDCAYYQLERSGGQKYGKHISKYRCSCFLKQFIINNNALSRDSSVLVRSTATGRLQEKLSCFRLNLTQWCHTMTEPPIKFASLQVTSAAVVLCFPFCYFSVVLTLQYMFPFPACKQLP